MVKKGPDVLSTKNFHLFAGATEMVAHVDRFIVRCIFMKEKKSLLRRKKGLLYAGHRCHWPPSMHSHPIDMEEPISDISLIVHMSGAEYIFSATCLNSVRCTV